MLCSFLGVGTVERIVESLEVVCRRAAEFGIYLLPVEKLRRLNITVASDEDFSWVESDPLGVRLKEALAADRELYAFAEELLDASRSADTPKSEAS
jgi:hypothetical protein